MNPGLTHKLYSKYPAIFARRCGFEHGDGWYGIIDTMCLAMSANLTQLLVIEESRALALGIERCEKTGKYWLEVGIPQVVAAQVKEKFGTLRFYYDLEYEPLFRELAFGDDPLPEASAIADQFSSFLQGIVHYACTLSGRVCEVTGKAGEMHTTGGMPNGWLRTLNREFARTDEFCRSRNYLPLADFPRTEDRS